MNDYHAIQMTGTPCAPRNCAAASDAMAIYAGSGGIHQLTADQVRARSGVSCIPGKDTPSGGLYISDVERVAAMFDVVLDYGPGDVPKRWHPSEAQARMSGPYGGIILGDYDQIPAPYRAPGSTFQGDHSAYAHAYRDSDKTVCWHDPLRAKPIRLPMAIFQRYWQKPGSPVRGYAGWVRIPPPVKRYRAYFRPLAVVRTYRLDHPIHGNTACIGRPWVDKRWYNAASSAPCESPVNRQTCDGTSSATTTLITAGSYAGKHIRVGYGVTVKEV